MDKFEAMQRFLLVAETRSFTQAAELLGLPKSSISAAIQSLEKRLGTRLFHRSTRSVTLTQDGASYLSQCRTILDELDALESQFQYDSDAVRGAIRIDMPSRFASNIVLPHLSEWLEVYPNTQLKISSADYLIDPVKEGIDCLIRVGTLTDSSLIARPLATLQIRNCASPDYLEKFSRPECLADLEHHRLVDYSPKMGNSPAMFEYAEQGRVRQLPMASRLAVNGTDAYLAACLAGLGIAQTPLVGIKDYLRQGTLICVLPDLQAEPMPVSLLYPSRRQLPKRLSLFMEWLEALVRRLDIA